MPCADCGGTFPPVVMDFHHRDPEEKVASIARLMFTKGRSTILAEIDKCDLLCANCHRLREYT